MTRLRVLVFFFCGGGRVLGTSVLRYARPGARVGTILRGHAARGPFQRPAPPHVAPWALRGSCRTAH